MIIDYMINYRHEYYHLSAIRSLGKALNIGFVIVKVG